MDVACVVTSNLAPHKLRPRRHATSRGAGEVEVDVEELRAVPPHRSACARVCLGVCVSGVRARVCAPGRAGLRELPHARDAGGWTLAPGGSWHGVAAASRPRFMKVPGRLACAALRNM